MKLNFVIRIWKAELSVFYNKSLRQVQIAMGRRFFEGSTEYKKAFVVLKSSDKDLFVFPKKEQNKALDLAKYYKSNVHHKPLPLKPAELYAKSVASLTWDAGRKVGNCDCITCLKANENAKENHLNKLF